MAQDVEQGAQTWTVWDAEMGYTRTSLLTPGELGDRPDGAEPLWAVFEVDAAGRRGVGRFPHSVFEWRSAEYGFDPDDVDGLLDVILHERFIPDPQDGMALFDPVARKILDDIAGLPDCWTPGVPDAERREAHLARIAAVKARSVQVKPASRRDRQDALTYIGSTRRAPAHPLAMIRDNVRLDPARVNARKLAVSQRRGDGPVSWSRKPPATFIGPEFELGPMWDGAQ